MIDAKRLSRETARLCFPARVAQKKTRRKAGSRKTIAVGSVAARIAAGRAAGRRAARALAGAIRAAVAAAVRRHVAMAHVMVGHPMIMHRMMVHLGERERRRPRDEGGGDEQGLQHR